MKGKGDKIPVYQLEINQKKKKQSYWGQVFKKIRTKECEGNEDLRNMQKILTTLEEKKGRQNNDWFLLGIQLTQLVKNNRQKRKLEG